MSELVNTEQSLSTLALEIQREHEAVETGVRATVEAAIRCGWLLRKAKAQVPHGSWLYWLAKNFPASQRTAQVYMRVAAEQRSLDRTNPQLPAGLTLEDALKQLATPREEKGKRASSNGPVVEPAPHEDDELERLRGDVAQAKRAVAHAQARLDRAKAALHEYHRRQGVIER